MPFGLISSLINAGAYATQVANQRDDNAYNRMQQEWINNVNWINTRALNQQNRNWELEDQARLEAREDNAIQRRARDLEAAGINPILAAGGGAGGAQASTANGKNTSVFTPAQFTPQQLREIKGFDLGIGDPIERALERERQIAEIENIDADTQAKKSGKKGTDLDNIRKEVENEYVKDKILAELKGTELTNKNMEQVTKNLMAEYGYRMNQEQREKAWHEIEKLNAQTERTLKAAQTANYMSNTDLTDQERTLRKKEFELKKKQIEQGYYATLAEIIGNSAGNALRGKK